LHTTTRPNRRRAVAIDIGKEVRKITVTPIETPVPEREPARRTVPTRAPEKTPSPPRKVPVKR